MYRSMRNSLFFRHFQKSITLMLTLLRISNENTTGLKHMTTRCVRLTSFDFTQDFKSMDNPSAYESILKCKWRRYSELHGNVNSVSLFSWMPCDPAAGRHYAPSTCHSDDTNLAGPVQRGVTKGICGTETYLPNTS